MNRKLILISLGTFLAGAAGMFLLHLSGVLKSSDHHHSEKKEEHDGHGPGKPHEDVALTPEGAKAAQLTFAKVEKRVLHGDLVVPGVVAANADRTVHVTPRLRGRVETIAAVLGQDVKRGDALAELDSVDLGTSRAAYRKALAIRKEAEKRFESFERVKDKITLTEYLAAQSAFEIAKIEQAAARETLVLYGVSEEEIQELAGECKHPIGYFPIAAPFDGTIIEKHVTKGEVVDTGNNLFTIADLSTVWVILDLHHRDLSESRVGQRVECRIQGFPTPLEGQIAYISDVVRGETRTIEARVVLENKERRIKPGMFVSATLQRTDGEAVLSVPVEAVQRIGEETVVFAREEDEEHHFKKITVTLGRRTGERYAVVAGLKEGDEVVCSGSFILKSEFLRAQMGHDHAH